LVSGPKDVLDLWEFVKELLGLRVLDPLHDPDQVLVVNLSISRKLDEILQKFDN
jgi:hypothetical protein